MRRKGEEGGGEGEEEEMLEAQQTKSKTHEYWR